MFFRRPWKRKLTELSSGPAPSQANPDAASYKLESEQVPERVSCKRHIVTKKQAKQSECVRSFALCLGHGF